MARRLSGFTSDLFTSLTDSGTNEAGRADNAVNEAADPTQGKDRRVVIFGRRARRSGGRPPAGTLMSIRSHPELQC